MSQVQSARPNANGNLFEIRTVQSAAFRTLIEALKEILTEANLEFDSTGIKVIDVDETHTVLTFLRLHSDRFEYFYCPVKYILGINMIYLFKLIKTLSNNDSLTLFLPADNPNKLGIRAENAEKFSLQAMDTKLWSILDKYVPVFATENKFVLPKLKSVGSLVANATDKLVLPKLKMQ